MKIKILTLAVGAERVLRPGDIVELSDKEAAQFIEGGYAVSLEQPEEEKPVKQPEEKPEKKPAPKTTKKKG